MQVSIGIPFFNAESTIADAIRSVFAQSFHDWELILLDDGSSDSSLNIVQSIRDPRVRILSDKQNQGLPFRLNQLASIAKGRYLARMDADDLMHPDRIRRQIEHLDLNKEIFVLGTATYTIDSDSNPMGKRGLRKVQCSLASVIEHGFLIFPTVTGHTSWFKSNPFNPSFRRSQDLELWCRTCEQGIFANIPELLFFYRESNNFNLRAYLESGDNVRKLIEAYGPKAIGRSKTKWLICKSKMKDLLYQCLSWIKQEKIAVARRNSRLLLSEVEAARQVIEVVKSTKVPGW